MRDVKYGVFQDYKPYDDDIDYDMRLIGMNIAANNEQRQLASTRTNEFYITDAEDNNVMIKDATALEKFVAKIKYTFTRYKKDVVGYRSTKMSDMQRSGYELDKAWDEKTNSWVQDKEYYKSKGYDPDTFVSPMNKEENDPLDNISKQELIQIKNQIINKDDQFIAKEEITDNESITR